ncbi:MAG TPA: DUF2959 family protein [Phycisphaerales bacterium]|nr:DUF2959 family protein [Phycisphaerales bacterium]
MNRIATPLLVLVAIVFAAPLGCSKAYYRTMEAFGKEKRDILTSRVKEAQEGQEEAKEQFESALDRFSKLVNAPDSDLRKAYNRAKDDFDRSESRANAVRDKVDAVEEVGRDLFNEWERELKEYSTEDARSRSRRQLQETRRRYDQMLAAMKRAEASMDPVLDRFRDAVLSLKHTLNAEAVAALRGTVSDLEDEVESLIKDMERSIEESNRFIAQMQKAEE